MGLDDSMDESVSSSTLAAPSAEPPSGHRGELSGEEVKVNRVLWCYCLQVKEEVEQKRTCLVLTDRLLGLLYLSDDFTSTGQDAGKRHKQSFCWN